jgi:hypothetical protein
VANQIADSEDGYKNHMGEVDMDIELELEDQYLRA